MSAPRTALVVDDDAACRRLLVRLLEEEGWRVLEAGTGLGAIEHANGAPLNLILLDIRMPGSIDGLRAAFLLRQEPAYRHVPIIAVSASLQDDFRYRAFAAGCTAFVSKPVDLKKLRAEIERLVGPPSPR